MTKFILAHKWEIFTIWFFICVLYVVFITFPIKNSKLIKSRNDLLKFVDLFFKYPNYVLLILLGALGMWSNLTKVKLFNWIPSQEGFIFLYLLVGITQIVIEISKNKYQELVVVKGFEDKITNLENINNIELNKVNSKLENERVDVLCAILIEMSSENQLNFEMSERICIYLFEDQNKDFELIARYSSHYEFNLHTDARKRYPSDSGVIGHVWSKGIHNGYIRDNNLPESQKKYEDYLNKTYNIPHAISRKFRMKARDIAGFLIRDIKFRPIGVIIFESQTPNKLDDKIIERVYNSKCHSLMTILQNVKEARVNKKISPEELGI